jgi:hypothetical protein
VNASLVEFTAVMREAPVVRPLLEASLAIDVRRWHRQGLLTLPVSSSACNGRAAALACWSGATASRTVSSWERTGDHPASRVFQLDEVYFRGDRPWFIFSRCAARAYLRGERWVCRLRCNLAHESEVELKGYCGQWRAPSGIRWAAKLSGDG